MRCTLIRKSCFPDPVRLLGILAPSSVEWAQHRRDQTGSTDLQAGHTEEHSRGVMEVNPVAQQVASIGKVQKTVLLLALRVLAARVRHVPLDTCTVPASAARV